MDVVERLSLEAASADTAIAAEQLHRYELAAELCEGLRVADVGCGSGYGCRVLGARARAVTGVDSDSATVDRARTELAGRDGIEFEVAGASEFLRRDLEGSIDALVVFETLEQLADPERALSDLGRHATAGLKLVVSLPNSKALGERDPHRGTDYGYEEALAAFERLGSDVIVLHQYNAEGSLIRPPEASELGGRFVLGEHGEPEYCNHFIACVNFGPCPADAWSRMELTVAPGYNRHMLALERANRELSKANARLARSRIGSADSAASALLERLERSEEIRLRMERSISWRLTAPIRFAKGALLRAFPPRHLKNLAERVLPAPVFKALRALVHRYRQRRVDPTAPR